MVDAVGRVSSSSTYGSFSCKVKEIDLLIDSFVKKEGVWIYFNSSQRKILNHSLWSYRRELVEMNKFSMKGR